MASEKFSFEKFKGEPTAHPGATTAIQSWLKRTGFLKGGLTGKWDEKTGKALGEAQKKMGLSPTKYPDENTMKFIAKHVSHPLHYAIHDPIIQDKMKKDARFGETMKKAYNEGGMHAALLGAIYHKNEKQINETGRGNNGEFNFT